MLKKINSGEFIRGSIILFVTFGIFNVLNFIFQSSMARMLGPIEYGVFAAITAIIYFVATLSESVQIIVAKYTSAFNVEKKIGKIHYLINKIFGRGMKTSVKIFLFLIPFFILFSYFLKINIFLVLLTGSMIFSIFLLPVTRGVMQGMKKFDVLGINMILEGILKVIISIILVLSGIGVYGAVMGIIGGTLIAFLISLISIKDVLNGKKEDADISKIYSYSPSVLYAIFIILLMQSLDVLIAKSIFTAELAGQYAVANLMGKIIFFGTVAISKTMLPLSAERFEKGVKTNKLFNKALILTLLLCVSTIAIYGIFSELVVTILFGEEYLEISSIILNIAIAFTFISLANLIFTYGISINKQIKWYFLVLFILTHVILLIIFSQNIYNYSIAMVISGLVLFLGSLFIILKNK